MGFSRVRSLRAGTALGTALPQDVKLPEDDQVVKEMSVDERDGIVGGVYRKLMEIEVRKRWKLCYGREAADGGWGTRQGVQLAECTHRLCLTS